MQRSFLMKQKFNILIPMAGRGSRFTEQGYTDSKPFIDVDGKPIDVIFGDYYGQSSPQTFIIER